MFLLRKDSALLLLHWFGVLALASRMDHVVGRHRRVLLHVFLGAVVLHGLVGAEHLLAEGALVHGGMGGPAGVVGDLLAREHVGL